MSVTLSAPFTFCDIWKDLPKDVRGKASAALWRSKRSPAQIIAIDLLHRKFRSREQTVRAWPLTIKAERLAGIVDVPDELAKAIIRAYFFTTKKEMMRDLLDTLNIPHEDCSFDAAESKPPDELSIRRAISRLLRKFPSEDVKLYLAVLVADDADFWEALCGFALEDLKELTNCPEPDGECSDTPIRQPNFVAKPRQVELDAIEPETVGDIDRDIEELKTEFASVAETLKTIAKSIASGHIVQDDSIRDSLTGIRVHFGEIQSQVKRRSEELGLPSAVQPTTLAELERLVTQLKAAEQSLFEAGRVKHAAATMLANVIALRRTGGKVDPALTTCQQGARELMLNSHDVCTPRWPLHNHAWYYFRRRDKHEHWQDSWRSSR